jgi:hypothetical protein
MISNHLTKLIMKKRILFLLAIAVFAASCANKKAVGSSDPNKFGESISTKGAMNYNDFLAKFTGKEKMDVKVKGTVTSVCQMKGCWITLNDGKGSPEVFVKFKDYGFFLPKDIAGREVVMEGYAFKEVTAVEELKHMAEDAGKTQAEIDAIKQPKEELKFMASGVVLLPPKKS